MEKTVYSFNQHSLYLKWRLDPRHSEWGTKTRFAKALRIQPAFLSQVLSEKHPLSMEQADLANQFFDHNHEESDFFLLLTSRDRAGTSTLKKHFQNKIDAALVQRQELASRLGKKSGISEEAKSIYYSSWLYAAIHVGCTIENLQTRRAIAEKFAISTDLAEKILDFLATNQILHKEGDRYKATQNWVRLDRSSPFIAKLHTNWRLRAINDLEKQTDRDLHYSGVYSASEKAIARLKENFTEFLSKEIKNLEAAPEEDLFVIGADIFKLLK